MKLASFATRALRRTKRPPMPAILAATQNKTPNLLSNNCNEAQSSSLSCLLHHPHGPKTREMTLFEQRRAAPFGKTNKQSTTPIRRFQKTSPFGWALVRSSRNLGRSPQSSARPSPARSSSGLAAWRDTRSTGRRRAWPRQRRSARTFCLSASCRRRAVRRHADTLSRRALRHARPRDRARAPSAREGAYCDATAAARAKLSLIIGASAFDLGPRDAAAQCDEPLRACKCLRRR